MEIVHVYQRQRRDFGRQCNFSDQPAMTLVDIEPDEKQREEYLFKNPADASVQCSKEFSEHEVNTERADFSDSGMNHQEGGWPKDVSPEDMEQTSRYRKKAEKEEVYVHSVVDASEMMEQCIKQNNAMDIYEDYFPTESQVATLEAPFAQTISVFRDPCDPHRSVTSMSWYPDGAKKLAVAYSVLEFQKAPAGTSVDSYIWDIEKPNVPELALTPSSPIVSIRYNPKDVHVLLGGLYNGQIGVWDTRKGSRPIETSPVERSHRDPVFAAEFLASKTGTEFFSCSSDGFVKWWDIRKMSEPTEELLMDIGDQQLGAVCLEFESTMPTRYMIGTEQGIVINGNKKGKTPAEKLAQTYTAHHGPIYTIRRNPFFPKYFMTVGDWTARIWSEDIRESAIMWTKYHDCRLTSGTWSLTRPGVSFTGRGDGIVDVWDYLHKQTEPVLSVQISKSSPTTCLESEVSGSIVACGCKDGSVSLVQLSDSLVTPRAGEKPLMAQLFERESTREKTLVARLRELALMERIKSSKPQATDETPDEEEDPIQQAEENFWQTVDPEKYSEMKAAKQDAEAAAAGEE
eukprot:m.357810 g.357810  ORF g.357810 m.357810 type:complete len:572 (+) comp17943_c0_seq1:313-2028(+)